MFKKLKGKLGKSARYVEFALVVLMFLLSFITFKNIFSQTQGGDYFQEVIAALIGTLLTVIITFILLGQQTKTEELKEQNVEVFKKRISRYEEMIQLLVDVREDGKVDEEEVRRLVKATYKLALVSSEETIFTLSQHIEKIVFDDKEELEEGDYSLVDVITCFRSELKLENIDDVSIDLTPIENLLANGFNKTEFNAMKEYMSDVRSKIYNYLESNMSAEIFKCYKFSSIARSDSSCYASISSSRSDLGYQMSLGHNGPDEEQLCFGVISSGAIDGNGDAKTISKAKMQRAEKFYAARAFEMGEDDEDWGYEKKYPTRGTKSGALTPTMLSKVALQIAQDIMAIEGFDLKESSSIHDTP